MNDTVEGLVKDFSLFLDHHLFGEHNNEFCYKWVQIIATNQRHQNGIVIRYCGIRLQKRWCTKTVLSKYLNCRDTNFEESANFIMISLYPKRLFGVVELIMTLQLIPLMLNQGG